LPANQSDLHRLPDTRPFHPRRSPHTQCSAPQAYPPPGPQCTAFNAQNARSGARSHGMHARPLLTHSVEYCYTQADTRASVTGVARMPDVETALARVREAQDAYVAAHRADQDAQLRRDRAVRRAHKAGASYQDIADILKVHRSYAYQICREDH